MKSKLTAAVSIGSLYFATLASGSTLYGIYSTRSAEHFISFDSASPATLTEDVTISGRVGNDAITDIAFQPSTGVLYGLGSNFLYTINPSTGVATEVSALPFLGSTQTGFGFDPVTGAIHLAGGSPQTDRILNPSTSSFTSTTSLAFASGDKNAGNTPAIVAEAFSNSLPGASSTTMYDLNVSNLTATLTTENEGTGALTTIGSGIGSFNSLPVGFTITSSGTAYVALAPFSNAGDTGLYSLNLATGALTSIDTIGGVNNFLNVGSIASPIVPAPEPTTLTLLGCALVGSLRRQRKSA